MKKLYIKINESWLRYKRWRESGIAGSFVASAVNIVFVMALFLVFFYALGIFNPFSEKDLSQDSSASDSSEFANENCNVTGINLHGTLLTYIPNHSENDSLFNYDSVSSENIMGAIKAANNNPEIKGIVIEIDSPGGSPVAGEEVANAIKHSQKPVAALIRSVGASAAYLSISSADKIFASKYSDVGSIGITGSYLNNVAKNNKDGYSFEELSVGRFKDAGNPDKALTNEEKAVFLRDLTIAYEYFVKAVSENRKISIEKVKSFADGSTVLGVKAKELGLIDETGDIYEVEKYLKEIIGEKPDICWQ